MVEDADAAPRWCLSQGVVLGPGGWEQRDLFIDSGRIVTSLESGAAQGIDCRDVRLIPGYIDLQINGGWGIDLQSRPDLLWDLAAELPAVGVTSFLPTLTTNGFHRLDDALTASGEGAPSAGCGADPIGWHLEGPWISSRRSGAHDRSRIEPLPEPSRVPPEVSRSAGVRLVTLAPELDGAHECIAELVRRGVVVSVGHSEATADETRSAMQAGASMGTHLFNAMTGLDHRRPGVAAALLGSEANSWIGLIADGQHVSVELLSLAWRLASDRIVLVSDAVAGLGRVEESVARLTDGTIAGALTPLDQCVRLLVDEAGASPASAISAASMQPAAALGLEDRGSLEPGRRADVVALDDDLRVVFTMIGGELVFDCR